MAPMKRRILTTAVVLGVSLASGAATADTVYHCGFKDGVPYFTINTKPPGRKCRVYSTGGRDQAARAPEGARCRTQRFRDSVFYTCEKDGILWYFNKPTSRPPGDVGGGRDAVAATARPRRQTDTSGAQAGSDAADAAEPTRPSTNDREGAPADVPIELAGMDSRRMDGAYLRDIVLRASTAQGIPVALLRAVIEVESGANPDVVSPAGAQGLMQLMPVTAGYLDVEDPFDPEQNVMAGARLLRILSDRFHGDVTKTVAAYYAGASAVRRAGGVPTRSAENYVAKVLSRYQKYSNPAD